MTTTEQPKIAFTITDAPNRLKGQVIVKTPSDTGYKSRAAFLAQWCGRWSGRFNGYVMTQARAVLFAELYEEGWRGCVIQRGFIPPAGSGGNPLFTLTAVKAYRKGQR